MRILRIKNDVDAAGAIVDVQNLFPVLASVAASGKSRVPGSGRTRGPGLLQTRHRAASGERSRAPICRESFNPIFVHVFPASTDL